MGKDIHMVIQKRDPKTKEWSTVLEDLCAGRNHELFDFLSGSHFHQGIAAEGLPEDFVRGNTDLGDYGFGHLTLDKFVQSEVKAPKPEDRYSIEKRGDSMLISFLTEEEYDYTKAIRSLQDAFAFLFFDLENYRMVFGFSC